MRNINCHTVTLTSTFIIPRSTSASVRSIIFAELWAIRASAQITCTSESRWRALLSLKLSNTNVGTIISPCSHRLPMSFTSRIDQ